MSEWEDKQDITHVSFDEFLHKTDKQFLFLIANRKVWLPRSEITNEEEILTGDETEEVHIPIWLAEDREID